MFLFFLNNFWIIFGNFGLISKSVRVVYSEQRSRESCYLAEAYQQAFVYLALRSDKRPAEQEH